MNCFSRLYCKHILIYFKSCVTHGDFAMCDCSVHGWDAGRLPPRPGLRGREQELDRQPRGTSRAHLHCGAYMILPDRCMVSTGRRVVQQREDVQVPDKDPPWVVQLHGETDHLHRHHERQLRRQSWSVSLNSKRRHGYMINLGQTKCIPSTYDLRIFIMQISTTGTG